jgi:tRNA(Arg) A34 adenosine deaminase TadA
MKNKELCQKMATADLFPQRRPLTPSQISNAMEACLTVQRRAVKFGKRPFAAVLLGPDNETVLLTHQSVDQVNHAEASLARLAYTHYSKEFLWTCTLVSTWEPCAMCTATLYWAHIGGLVYGASNEDLYRLTGEGNKENFTMSWNCRDVLAGCKQKDIVVVGPLEEEGRTVVRESDEYWSKTEGRTAAEGKESAQ